MTGSLLRRWLPLGAAMLLGIAGTARGAVCPGCNMKGTTLLEEVQNAQMVVYGSLRNARLAAGGGEGTTELQIEKVIKTHEVLGNAKEITLDRYLPEDKDTRILLFCEVFQGKVDPYRGVTVKANSGIEKYLAGAVALKDKDVGKRLRYFFDYLDSADSEITVDAYKEFGNTDYKECEAVFKTLPREKLSAWLRDPKTPAYRYGLYALMLGHCGHDEDAKLLRSMLDAPENRAVSGVDAMQMGYILLRPKEGWEYLSDRLKDPAAEFAQRYAGLRTIRFFQEYRPDVLNGKQLVEGTAVLLDQNDIADLAIEDLRRWHAWDVADKVLALYSKPSHDQPIIRRSILRYALGYVSDPKNPTDSPAARFVNELRKKDPQLIKDAEELLKLETNAPPAGPPE